MPSIADLEAEYAEMTSRNSKTSHWSCIGKDDKQCLAISTLGDWYLDPYSWSRFQQWLTPLKGSSVLYTPRPEGEQGQLHWTLQQCQPFTSEPSTLTDIDFTPLNPVFEELRGLTIVYRGLSVTTSGLVLRGFPANERQYQGILRARRMLPSIFEQMGLEYKEPYANTICHATVLRWRDTPTLQQLQYMSETIHMWDECVLAQLKPRNWIIGHLTLRVRSNDSAFLHRFHTPRHIAHRGLLRGPDSTLENTVQQLESNASAGIISECDIWFNDGGFWLGHDTPEYPISYEWICNMKDVILIHAKDLRSFHELKRLRDEEGIDLHIFYHTDEDVVMTTHGDCIVYPGLPVLNGWISMMPERTPLIKIKDYALAICSDFVSV